MLILLDWNRKWLVRIRWIYIIINREAIKVSTKTNGPTQFYSKGGLFLTFCFDPFDGKRYWGGSSKPGSMS